MTLTLKVESTIGKRYDSLFDSAKSLVNGLGGMLRLAARGARVYDLESQGNFQIKASVVDVNKRLSLKSRKVTFTPRKSSLPYSLATRTKRDANNAQLQVKNR